MENKTTKKLPCIICKKLLTKMSNECCDSCMFPKGKKKTEATKHPGLTL